MRLRWKKHEKETGLARVCAGPRGSDYTDGTEKYATVYAHGIWGRKHKSGWWFCGRIGGHWLNTSDDKPFATEGEAKATASAWVKEQLKEIANG